MPLNYLISILRNFFTTQPVEKAWIFGSFATGQQRDDSDLDILVKYTKGTRLGLFGIINLKNNLEQIVGRKVDLVEDGTLFPRVAQEVENQKIMIYER